jgi:hypothetical protein
MLLEEAAARWVLAEAAARSVLAEAAEMAPLEITSFRIKEIEMLVPASP